MLMALPLTRVNAGEVLDMFDDKATGSSSEASPDIFDDRPKAKPKKKTRPKEKSYKTNNNSSSSGKKTETKSFYKKASIKNISSGKTTVGVIADGTKGPIRESLYTFTDFETHKGKTSNTIYGKFIIFNNVSSSRSNRDNVNFRMVVYWKFWTLMGEPVLNSTARWQIRAVYLYDKKTGKNTCYSSEEMGGCEYAPPEVMGKVSIVDLRVLTESVIGLSPSALRKGGHFSDSGYFIIDPGILSTPEVYTGGNENIVGTLGYNVAGSPNWNSFIITRNINDYHKRHFLKFKDFSTIAAKEDLYFPEDKAKKFIKDAYEKDFSLRFNDILYVDYSTLSLRQWVSNQKRIKAEEKATQLKAEKLEELRALKKDKELYTEKEYKEEINALNKRYEKNDPIKAVDREDREIQAGKEEVRAFLALKRIEIDARTLPGNKIVAFKDEKTGKYGYKLEKSDKIIIEAQYGYASDFSNGLGLVIDDTNINEKYGYVNDKGIIVIPTKYYGAEDFSEGLAAVKTGRGNWVYINKKGETINDFKYDSVHSFSEGLAAVHNFSEWGYINKKGETAIDFKYNHACSFSEGLAAVHNSRGWGYINKKGETVIDYRYDSFNSFSEGLAAVKNSRGWGYINKDGTMVAGFKYYSAHDFSEGLAAVEEPKTRKWGYINKDGIMVTGFKYYSAHDFSEGLAAVCLTSMVNSEEDSKWGYVDKIGSLKINAIYSYACDFINGQATVTEYISSTPQTRCGSWTLYSDAYEINKSGCLVGSKKRVSRHDGEICLYSD